MSCMSQEILRREKEMGLLGRLQGGFAMIELGQILGRAGNCPKCGGGMASANRRRDGSVEEKPVRCLCGHEYGAEEIRTELSEFFRKNG